jgi:hypothetical protein
MTALKWSGVLGAATFVAVLTWNWLDDNLLHWGIEDDRTSYVNDAELLRTLQAFEVVSIKHDYRASAEIEVDKSLRAGPARVGLPGWLAGQELKVTGDVTVAAGTDLAALTQDDIVVINEDDRQRVIIHVPAPQILSSQIRNDSTDIDTSQGVLTRASGRLGFDERDLRDEASDRLVNVANRAALDHGILSDASRQAKARLETFLASITPRESGVFYEVVVDAPLS